MRNKHSEVLSNTSWYNITPSWSDHILRPDKDFGIKYLGDGWYEHHGNWMLINKTITGFHVIVWNGHDPRPFLTKIAEAEVRT